MMTSLVVVSYRSFHSSRASLDRMVLYHAVKSSFVFPAKVGNFLSFGPCWSQNCLASAAAVFAVIVCAKEMVASWFTAVVRADMTLGSVVVVVTDGCGLTLSLEIVDVSRARVLSCCAMSV